MKAIRSKKWKIVSIVTVIAITTTVILIVTQSPFIPTVDPVVGEFNAEVFDSDTTSSEIFSNENMVIRFYTTVKSLRYVGDKDHGLIVKISNTTRGWGTFVADVKGQENYARGYVEENGYWAASAAQNAFVRWSLHVPVTVVGKLEHGENAYLYLWVDNDNEETNSYGTGHKPAAMLWNRGDVLELTASSYGDGFSTPPSGLTISGVNRVG
ncbi:MAG: hypothetical protein AB1476_00435 [Candidatus Hadarchaeota archaeon]